MFGAPRMASRAIAAAQSSGVAQLEPGLRGRQQRLIEDLKAPVAPAQGDDGKRCRGHGHDAMLLSQGMRRLLLAALAAALVAPAVPSAADPIMPLGDVQAGMRCTALTVVRGTAITSFDVEVLDVIDRQRPESARILVRVSGPAVDATGHRPGLLRLADLLPRRRRRRAQHRRDLRRHRPVRRHRRARDADRADPRRAGPAALVGARASRSPSSAAAASPAR